MYAFDFYGFNINNKILQKLEQTVAGNARLEQELAVLRQKLQGQQVAIESGNGIDTKAAADATALLENG